MSVVNYKYNSKAKLTKNFNVSEFKCKCKGTHDIKIDVDFVKKIQDFMNKNGYDVGIISSAYRCSKHDKAVGGSGKGQHTLGKACDICFKKGGKVVDAKEVCCKAQDYGFKGIAYITSAYVHLDNRSSGTYRGDERKGFSNNVGGDFYKYFGIKKEVEFTKGTYQLLKAKYLRTTPDVTNSNMIKYKGLITDIQKMCEKDALGYAKFKKYVNVELVDFTTDSKKRIWGRRKGINTDLYICVKDNTGNQVKLVK